jgi:tetratricopeptide (TPR) repeat protein
LAGAAWLVQERQEEARNRRQMAQSQALILEAKELERGLRLEETEPGHDLRPALARIRAFRDRVRVQVPTFDAIWRAQAQFALGSADFMLHDFTAAEAALGQAWAGGLQTPEAAQLLTRATFRVADAAELKAQFETGRAAPAADRPQVPHGDPGAQADDFAEALAAYGNQDYLRAASCARGAVQAFPWRREAVLLAVDSLAALAGQDLAAGNLPRARVRFQEAMASATAALALAPGDPDLHHAYFKGARGLAALALETGQLSVPWMLELQTGCDRALALDPEDPALQDDWLALRGLKVMRLADLGQDPMPDLEAAQAWMATRLKAPLPVPLRADRMVILWQMAERELSHGGDPGPALAEALRDPGHTPFLYRDYLREVLNCKARAEARRGADPRPTLASALDQLEPQMPTDAPWTVRETAAGSWLIRAGWESGHGLDAAASFRNARALAESAHSRNPDAASAFALEGLAQVQEMQAAPSEIPWLLPMAKASLRHSLALGARGRQQDLLRTALLRIPG